MNSPTRPTEEAKAEALKNPGGWVYEIDGVYGPDGDVPPEAICGAWKVDSEGKITGEFVRNPRYRPSAQKMITRERAVKIGRQLARSMLGQEVRLWDVQLMDPRDLATRGAMTFSRDERLDLLRRNRKHWVLSFKPRDPTAEAEVVIYVDSEAGRGRVLVQ